MAVGRILFLLLVLVWQQQDFFSYYWFLCDNNKTSFLTVGSCVAAARLPIVGSCVTTIRYPFFHAWSVGLEFEVDVHE